MRVLIDLMDSLRGRRRKRRRVYSFIYHLFLILIFSNELMIFGATAANVTPRLLITNSNHDKEITFRLVDKLSSRDRFYHVVYGENETREVFRARRDGHDNDDHEQQTENLEQIKDNEYMTTTSLNDIVFTSGLFTSGDDSMAVVINSQANSTCHMMQPLSDEELNKQYYSVSNIIRMVVLSVVYSTIIICTLVGNMLVILAVVIVRKLHSQDNANNYLIVSLAVSDLLVGVLAMPLAFYVDLSKGNK